MKSIIIEVDAFKKKIPGYDPKKAFDFHKESAKRADRAFKKALKKPKFKRVVLMCGGSCSGKSEFTSSKLVNTGVIVYDGTLYNFEGAKVKIRNSEGKKKKVEVYAIIPDNISRAFSAFLERDRKVPIPVFFKTHSGCRRTLLWISKNRPDIPLRIFESSASPGNRLEIMERLFKTKEKRDNFIKQIQLSEVEVERKTKP